MPKWMLTVIFVMPVIVITGFTLLGDTATADDSIISNAFHKLGNSILDSVISGFMPECNPL